MTKEVKGYPANQPFNVSPRRNLTKKKSWWAVAPFHNNGSKRSKSN